jgi:hypothetical protein
MRTPVPSTQVIGYILQRPPGQRRPGLRLAQQQHKRADGAAGDPKVARPD